VNAAAISPCDDDSLHGGDELVRHLHFSDSDLPRSVGHRLESMLYGAPLSTVAYTAGLTVMSLALWLRTGDPTLTACAIACVMLVGFRVAYVACRKPSPGESASTWYLPTLLIFGCIYSALLAVLIIRAFAIGDPVAISLVVVAAAGYVSGVTIRAAAVPAIAIPHASTLFAPLIAAAAITSGGEYWAAAVLLICYWVGSVQLITTMHGRIRAQLLAEHYLAFAASTDVLTGLANRSAFDGALSQQLASGTTAIVAMIDLDRFKQVNDTHGHDAGDELLKSVATRIRAALSGRHLVGRLGGDEFAVLFEVEFGVADATRAAETIVRSLEQPFALLAAAVTIGASIGLAAAVDGDTARSLKKRADDRLYDVKRGGRGQVAVATLSEAA
jgi:diguanylate cyclase (GGDEF)-like protein